MFIFIVFMIFRVGDHGDIFYWGLGPLPPTTTTTTTSVTTVTPTTTTASNGIYYNICELTLNIYLFVIFSEFERNIFLGKLLHSQATEDKESFRSSDCVLSERDENDLVFGIMTTVGYWFITIVLMIGLILGDRPKMTVNNNIFI